MQIDGRTPSFSDNVDYPPPPYLYPTFQVQQPPLHNARHPVESSPPLYGSAASARDRAFCLSRYGIPQPELARYPESSQRTHLDDDLSRSMYRFASSSSQLPPDMLRGPNTVLPIERVEANILNERTPGRELVHCKPDNIPLEAHASHFTHQQPIASAPQLSLPTSYLPHDDAVPFSYYSSLPHRRTSNTSSASDLSPFVDSGEAMATVFNPAGFPLETRPPPPSAPTLPRHHDLNPVVAFQMGSLSPLDDSDAGPSLNPSDNSMKYHSPHHATKYGYDSTPIATPSPTIVTPSLTMPDLHGHFSESSLSSAFNDQNADCIAHSESSSPPPSHSGSESSTQPSEAPFSRSGSVVASNARPATVAITTTPRRRGKKKLSKMHECDICHKQFPRPSGLTTHQNSHAGIKRKPIVQIRSSLTKPADLVYPSVQMLLSRL
jgi:hypothetical protein